MRTIATPSNSRHWRRISALTTSLPCCCQKPRKATRRESKALLPNSRLTYDAEAFLQNFQNLVVPLPSGLLTNAAHERLKGASPRTRYALLPDLT